MPTTLNAAARAAALPVLAALTVATAACSPPDNAADGAESDAPDAAAGSVAAGDSAGAALVAQVTGLDGPEAVRYDPDQDVYFVANFSGDGGDADDNGFITRVRAEDGSIEALRFIDGADPDVTLHAPRGMAIAGDTLWAADVDAVRGFDRRTGEPLASVDFSDRDVGFLNDVAIGADGSLYVTDTGGNLIWRIRDGRIDVAYEGDALGSPNGITPRDGGFIVVPYGGDAGILGWRPGEEPEPIGQGAGGRYDGVELLDGGAILVASQADSTLHLFRDGRGAPIVRLPGRPADIGVDTRRGRVAVPYIALDRVDVFDIDAGGRR